VFRPPEFLLNDKLGWQAINIIEVSDKPGPTSDAQECAGRLEHTCGSSLGQRLKSPANQGIAESEWHEPIISSAKQSNDTHHAIRFWVPAFRCWHHTSTICHDFKMLGQAKGMRANNGRQPLHLCSMVQVSSSRGNCL